MNAHPIEQLGNSVAAALLMPVSSLDALIGAQKVGDVHHLVEVAAELRVSPEALGWRLFGLERIDADTRAALTLCWTRTTRLALPGCFPAASSRCCTWPLTEAD